MPVNRRTALGLASAGFFAAPNLAIAADPVAGGDLKITKVTITPIALPDPPILAAMGCHGPYFLRNVVEIETADGIRGLGETKGNAEVTKALEEAASLVVGQSATAYRRFAAEINALGRGVYAGIELACLDALGKATNRRLCELLGGPVRNEVEFSSYLFYRYAADHPKLLADPRIVDERGSGERALDQFGEVRTPAAMADLAAEFHRRYGFKIHKLKAGVLPPDVELETLRAIVDRLGPGHQVRIDPNAHWTIPTAVRIGEQLKSLPLEYYEDPVRSQEAMAMVRERTGLRMSTNMCVTEFDHIPPATVTRPIDVVLCDHHGWGGIGACQALGPIATSLGWTVSQHSNNHAGITMAAMIHVAAVVPELTVASDTHYPWLVETADIIVGGKLKIAGGKMQIPSKPGVGVELDRDALARAHETYRKSGMTERDDLRTMQLIHPGWSPELY
jgi:glucarate dehydratase